MYLAILNQSVLRQPIFNIFLIHFETRMLFHATNRVYAKARSIFCCYVGTRGYCQYRDFYLIFRDLYCIIHYHAIWTREVNTMAISYSRLWKLLIDKRLKKTDLIDLCGISTNVLAKLGRAEAISMDSLQKICTALNCNIEDIVEFIPKEMEETK